MLAFVCRNVTDSDILALERRLLQTMDMIVSKKKRWEKRLFFLSFKDFLFLITTFINVKNCHDAEADVPERGRPEQADGILGDDQERHLHTIGQ